MESHVKTQTSRATKIDPSFKSKRYRDKLRTEIKGLEGLIPLDRSSLHRKLDSQTVFRLIISFFRIKMFFKGIGLVQHDPTIAKEEEGQSFVDKHFGAKQVLQCLDGFLLTAFTDGTIVYSTENVLQYLGFNQVDLMHRCLYGLVHPEDHGDLKNLLENRFMKDALKNEDNWRQVSFICRMKCFNGTSAGYLKIHCSGSIQRAEDTPQPKSSPDVMLLYCQPFMLTGSDIVEDFKQNVFWSKHDMGLIIKEFDKKSEDIIGLSDDDLKDKSFYQFVHPEDLATFAACHKTLTESTEVQSMYFRMEAKDGVWIWLHSRGKVICKNSKKFSIVFTHCPVREEDSTFLQQESSLRQRYAMNDLLYFIQFGSPYAPCSGDGDDCMSDDQHGPAKLSTFCTPHMGFTEDVSMAFYNTLDPCPSSWHTLSDRHSPVLPSTHVAHKITQREKQLQFQEFKRRQQMCNQTVYPVYNSCLPYVAPQLYSCDQISQERHPQTINSVSVKTEPVVNAMPTCSNINWNEHRNFQNGFHSYTDNYSSPYCIPTHSHNNGYQEYVYPSVNSYPPQYPTTYVSTEAYFPHNMNPTYTNNESKIPGNSWFQQEEIQCNKPEIPQKANKRASIKVSMNCDYSRLGQAPIINNTQSRGNIQNRMTRIKSEDSSSVVHYDIEASVHMKIVENTCRDNNCVRNKTHEVDLPSIGSLFEFLNE